MNDISLVQLFSPPHDPSLLTLGIYDPKLVVLSVLVAIFSSWMGLQMAGQAASTTVRGLRATALLTGSLALGSGVWAMHFIGMLAFNLCTHVNYDPAITIYSMLPSIAASFVALSLIGRQRIDGWQLAFGGLLFGAGIGAMHYTGMAAMEMSLVQRYDPLMFGLSIVVAVGLATLALWIRFGLHVFRDRLSRNWRLLIAAIVMGCAIAGMHYTGMAAARFVGQVPKGTVGTGNVTFIALAVSLITVALTIFVMAANGLLRYREMYRQLSESESWMRTLLATSVDGVIIIHADGQITDFNAAAEHIFGWSRGEIIGRNISVLIANPEQSRQDGVLSYLNQGADGVTSTSSEVLGLRKDLTVVPLRRALGHARLADQDMFVCMITDISESRQREEDLRIAKERAEQAAEARAAFLANMSHEIRTPMNSILGFTDVLLQGDLKQDQRRHLDIVRNAGRSLLRLLNEILDTAKLDKGAMELELNDFDLVALIDETTSTLGAEIRRKNLFLEIHYADKLPRHLHGDELRIRQVLTNLLGNAIKFTEVGGVALKIEAVEGQFHFSVRDTGIGIAADRLSSIFDPFTQADASMSRRFGGTGLGTTISKKLVELMGGRIWAESMPGRGSTFHFILPLGAAREAPASSRRQRGAAALPPLHILAADDVPQNLELLTLLLAKQGHKVVTVNEGSLAVKLAAETHFDAIIMDIQMPGMDGLEATRLIRAAESANAKRQVPIIAMTASVLVADRKATKDAGMNGFASKPVDPIALSHEIARVLGFATEGHDIPIDTEAKILDAARGLQRWADNTDVYHSALRRFATEYANCPHMLTQLLDAENFIEAQALAHKARGVSANLGLPLLASELALLERACIESDSSAATAQLAKLQGQFARAFDEIDEYIGTTGSAIDAAQPQTLDPAHILALSATLMQALRRGSVDDDALAKLEIAVKGHTVAMHVTELYKTIDNFDFDLAQTSLTALTAEISAARSAPR